MRKSIKQQLLIPVTIMTIIMAIIIYSFLIVKNEENIVNSIVTFSKNTLNQYKYLRQYYNHEIISVLDKHSDVKIDISSTKEEGTIPLPATLMQDLSSYINDKKSGVAIKFYSNYPFPNREDRVLNAFEQRAIKYLEENKTDIFYERSIYDGKQSVRVAVADIFENQSCVSCHNALPASPKKDWKLNDVGGVIEMIVSIEENIVQNKKNTMYSTFIISLFLVVLLLILYLILNKNILKPLDSIISYIKGLKEGDLESQMTLKQNNELDILLENIDSMRLSLKHNIQNLKNTSFELEESNDELETSLENLKLAQDKLIESEKMLSLGTLVAGIAHEVNTPIGIGLTGISHLLKESQDLKIKYDKEIMEEEDFQEYIQKSVEVSELIYMNLQRTVDLIKSFKQVSVDQVNEQKREFNLHEYITKVLLSLSSITKKSNIQIATEVDVNINMNSYPGVLSQILTNFVINSINHGFNKNEKGFINIKCEKIDKKIRIVYEDNGKGISSENLRKIFDPFFTTNRNNGGTGLGLHIVYNLVTSKLNGIIKCESQKGEFTRFILEFKSSN